ncbi:MAG: hypothetical protein JO170_14585, partial [Verrucomicrobia bacterium]|nr:hypothetical protein [Verrucomicrobiota bacterium]
MTAKTSSSAGQEIENGVKSRPRRSRIVFGIAAAAIVLCLLAYIIYRLAPQNPIRIAVVLPLSGPSEHRGKEALDAVNL